MREVVIFSATTSAVFPLWTSVSWTIWTHQSTCWRLALLINDDWHVFTATHLLISSPHLISSCSPLPLHHIYTRMLAHDARSCLVFMYSLYIYIYFLLYIVICYLLLLCMAQSA